LDLRYDASAPEILGVTLMAPHDVLGSDGTVVVNGVDGMVRGIGFATFDGASGTL